MNIDCVAIDIAACQLIAGKVPNRADHGVDGGVCVGLVLLAKNSLKIENKYSDLFPNMCAAVTTAIRRKRGIK